MVGPAGRAGAAAGLAASGLAASAAWRRSGVLAHRLPLRLELLGLLLGALRDDALRLPGGAGLEGDARGLRAGLQLRVIDAAGAGAFQLGDKRAAWIGRDRGDRPWTRAQSEPMQRQGGVSSGIVRHGAFPLRNCEEGIGRPATSSRPALNSMVEPEKSSPTGSARPPRCSARNNSSTALNERRFSARRKP